MILFTPKGMLSIVRHERHDMLVVQSRLQGHIPSLFPGVEEHLTPLSNYAWRAELPKARVAGVVSELVQRIDYQDDPREGDPHYRELLETVWHAGGDAQEDELHMLDKP